jgi:hypothetical protein
MVQERTLRLGNVSKIPIGRKDLWGCTEAWELPCSEPLLVLNSLRLKLIAVNAVTFYGYEWTNEWLARR